jgi:hypothetical protein
MAATPYLLDRYCPEQSLLVVTLTVWAVGGLLVYFNAKSFVDEATRFVV